MYGRNEKCKQGVCVKTLRRGAHLEDLGKDVRIVLTRQDERVHTGFVWLRKGESIGRLFLM